mmetsp:Transcript_70103/g.116900  ORF Transcript_70103/g.116900 Transcript_70103/m.116900 type:complete len:270 (+) Transcript_70103:196-1005(+)
MSPDRNHNCCGASSCSKALTTCVSPTNKVACVSTIALSATCARCCGTPHPRIPPAEGKTNVAPDMSAEVEPVAIPKECMRVTVTQLTSAAVIFRFPAASSPRRMTSAQLSGVADPKNAAGSAGSVTTSGTVSVDFSSASSHCTARPSTSPDTAATGARGSSASWVHRKLSVVAATAPLKGTPFCFRVCRLSMSLAVATEAPMWQHANCSRRLWCMLGRSEAMASPGRYPREWRAAARRETCADNCAYVNLTFSMGACRATASGVLSAMR